MYVDMDVEARGSEVAAQRTSHAANMDYHLIHNVISELKSIRIKYETLKQKLVEPPVLAYPNEHDTFILDTDASLFAAGACLSQMKNGEERVVAYGSKTFSNTQ